MNKSIKASDLKFYLLKHDWQPIYHPNKRIALFKAPDEAIITIPSSDKYSNSSRMIQEAIEILADHSNIKIDALQKYFNQLRQDTLTARLFKQHGDENSIPLDIAANAISTLRDFMSYAAFTQATPKPFFDKAGKVGTDFAKLCRFGHTFHGSFGFVIECPIEVTQELSLAKNLSSPPFERQVFNRIAQGLSILNKAITHNDLMFAVSNYQTGLNANMYQALVNIYEQVEGRQIQYDILWDSELQSVNEDGWRPFLFELRAYEFTRNVISRLEKCEETDDSLIEGPVVALKSESPPNLDQQEEFEHVITMFWEREKNQNVRIKIPLTPSHYIQACDAHKEGKKIRIFGIPIKSGKSWTLTKTHDFSVLL